jgi:hypothetical protein
MITESEKLFEAFCNNNGLQRLGGQKMENWLLDGIPKKKNTGHSYRHLDLRKVRIEPNTYETVIF